MKTHIELDDTLIKQVLLLGHFSTKKEAVNRALLEYVNHLKRQELLNLKGKVEWSGDLTQLRTTRD